MEGQDRTTKSSDKGEKPDHAKGFPSRPAAPPRSSSHFAADSAGFCERTGRRGVRRLGSAHGGGGLKDAGRAAARAARFSLRVLLRGGRRAAACLPRRG